MPSSHTKRVAWCFTNYVVTCVVRTPLFLTPVVERSKIVTFFVHTQCTQQIFMQIAIFFAFVKTKTRENHYVTATKPLTPWDVDCTRIFDIKCKLIKLFNYLLTIAHVILLKINFGDKKNFVLVFDMLYRLYQLIY